MEYNPTHYRGQQKPNTLDLLLANEEGVLTNLSHMAPLGKSHHQVLSSAKLSKRPLERRGSSILRSLLNTHNWEDELKEITTEKVGLLYKTISVYMKEAVIQHQKKEAPVD